MDRPRIRDEGRGSVTKRARGALVGVALAAVVMLLATTLGAGWSTPWLIAAIPAGATAGAVVGPWVRPGDRTPIRVVVGAALIADAVGIGIISVAISIVEHLGPYPPGESLFVEAITDALVLFLFSGWLGLIVLLPVAWIGALVLRRYAN